MDTSSNDEIIMVIGIVTLILVAKYVSLETFKILIVISKLHCIKRDKVRQDYTDSILYESYSHCIGQIRMDQDIFCQLLITLTIK